MSLRIRLRRFGRRGHPCYSVVVAESTAPRDGKFIDRVGTYQPLLAKDNPLRFSVDGSRVDHWLSKGALPTDTLVRLLIKANHVLPAAIKKRWDTRVAAWQKKLPS